MCAKQYISFQYTSDMLCVAKKGDKIYDFLTNVLTPFFYLTSNFQYHRRGASE